MLLDQYSLGKNDLEIPGRCARHRCDLCPQCNVLVLHLHHRSSSITTARRAVLRSFRIPRARCDRCTSCILGAIVSISNCLRSGPNRCVRVRRAKYFHFKGVLFDVLN